MEPLILLPRDDHRLGEQAGVIDDFANQEFQDFIDALIRCGEENDGVGIAAPQVGKAYRLFIMAPRPNPRYPDAPLMEPTAILNPEILSVSEDMEKGWEGCLSVPGFRGLVPRHLGIEVAFLDRYGHRRQEHFTGFLARLFQHEFDHLEGILFPNRMEASDSLVTIAEFTQLTGIEVSK
jgi:peptide deformylase